MSRDTVTANLTLTNLLPTAARTTTGVGSAIDLTAYEGVVAIILDSAAGTGTTPTLDVKLTDCATSGGTYGDISGAAFVQITTTASRQIIYVDVDKVKQFVKVSSTIGGTTPSFTYSVNVVGMKKYT